MTFPAPFVMTSRGDVKYRLETTCFFAVQQIYDGRKRIFHWRFCSDKPVGLPLRKWKKSCFVKTLRCPK